MTKKQKKQELERYHQVLAMREEGIESEKSFWNLYGKTYRFRFHINRWIIVIVLFTIIVFFMGFMTCSLLSKAKAEDDSTDSRFKYVTNITIEEGDTLWNIAKRYMSDEYKDPFAYIQEVCEINHLNDWNIVSGERLVVPYYGDRRTKSVIN